MHQHFRRLIPLIAHSSLCRSGLVGTLLLAAALTPDRSLAGHVQAATPTSIFTTQTPAATYAGAFELGVKFQSSVA